MEEEPISEAPPPSKPGKPKLKTIASWVSLARDAFSIIATLISFATLYLLIRQNERTYQPDVVVSMEQSVFKIEFKDTLRECTDFKIKAGKDNGQANASFSPTNIGLGAARDVQLIWEVDHAKLCDTVQFEGCSIPTTLRYQDDISALIFTACIFQNPLNRELDYLLPISAGGELPEMGTPSNYLIAWCNLLTKIARLEGRTNDEKVKLIQKYVTTYQDCRLKMEYVDINRKKYTKEFQLKLVPHQIDLRNNTGLIGIRMKEVRPGAQAPTEKSSLVIDFDQTAFQFVNLEI